MMIAEHRAAVVKIADAILRCGTAPIASCRALLSALDLCCPKLGEHPAVLALRGFVSETDDIPVGAERDLLSAASLSRLDAAGEEYWNRAGAEVRKACLELVALLGEGAV